MYFRELHNDQVQLDKWLHCVCALLVSHPVTLGPQKNWLDDLVQRQISTPSPTPNETTEYFFKYKYDNVDGLNLIIQ